MKPRPRRDYPVEVVLQTDEVPESIARYYEGIYRVVLNHTVDIAFVPDVSAVAPPWDGRQLPANLDDVSTVEQARIHMVLFNPYSVTPHPRLAGEVERVPELLSPPASGWQTPPELRRDWVRYVEPRPFDRFAAAA